MVRFIIFITHNNNIIDTLFMVAQDNKEGGHLMENHETYQEAKPLLI